MSIYCTWVHPFCLQTVLSQVIEMALWARTRMLTGGYLRQVQELYSTRFPMEVRHSIAPWIEMQNWYVLFRCQYSMYAFMLELYSCIFITTFILLPERHLAYLSVWWQIVWLAFAFHYSRSKWVLKLWQNWLYCNPVNKKAWLFDIFIL